MDRRPTKLDIVEEQAAGWVARKFSGTWSEADANALEDWLSQSTSHRIEFLRTQGTWNSSARLRALGAGVAKGTIPERHGWGDVRFPNGAQTSMDAASNGNAGESAGTSTRAKSRRLLFRRATLAASVMVLMVATYIAAGFWRADVYKTAVGAMRTVALADGSRVILNTDTVVRAQITEQERLIELEHGEAYFSVAKDASRPFIVRAGDRAITVLGTAFVVRHLEHREEDAGKPIAIRVTVTEGLVMMNPVSRHAATNTGPISASTSDAAPVVLAAGETAETLDSQLRRSKVGQKEMMEALSWRAGYINFDDIPLSEAVAEFNRYTTRKIVLDDERLGKLPVGGHFRAGNTAAFLWFLENRFSIRAKEARGSITLKQE